MSFTVAAVVAVGVGVAKAIDGGIKAKAAKDEAKEAQKELDKQKEAFSNLDTSNPYANMENTMEDLTVNTQEAEFAAEQSAQNRANIMQGMRSSAGGSGIAALAQTLANQGSLDAQKASASIGKQEAANQRAERAEAAKIQGMERQGEIMSRNMKKGKVEGLMGMAADELTAAREAQAAASEQMWDGISSAASAVGGMSFGGGTAPTGAPQLLDTIDPQQIANPSATNTGGLMLGGTSITGDPIYGG